MFGKHWVSAEATVVATRVTKATGDGMVSINDFVADVHTLKGEIFRAKVEEPRIATDFKDPVVGAVVVGLGHRSRDLPAARRREDQCPDLEAVTDVGRVKHGAKRSPPGHRVDGQ